MKRKISLISVIASISVAVCVICGLELLNARQVKACEGTVGGTEFACVGKFWKCIKYTNDNGGVVVCKGRAQTEASVPIE